MPLTTSDGGSIIPTSTSLPTHLQHHAALGCLVEEPLANHGRLRPRALDGKRLEQGRQALDDFHPREARSGLG